MKQEHRQWADDWVGLESVGRLARWSPSRVLGEDRKGAGAFRGAGSDLRPHKEEKQKKCASLHSLLLSVHRFQSLGTTNLTGMVTWVNPDLIDLIAA